MEEDWGVEANINPEPTFNFPGSTPTLYQQCQPKQLFLKYVKVVHSRKMSAKVRNQLNAERITDKNFQQWREESLRKAIDKFENPAKKSASLSLNSFFSYRFLLLTERSGHVIRELYSMLILSN